MVVMIFIKLCLPFAEYKKIAQSKKDAKKEKLIQASENVDEKDSGKIK